MRSPLAHSFFLLLTIIVFAGCGVPGRGPGDDGQGTGTSPSPQGALTLTPADPVLNVNGKDSQSLAFHVTRAGKDVTADAMLSLDNGLLGGFSGATFTANPGVGGKTTVRARIGNDVGATSLTVRITAVVIGPGAPSDAPGKFKGGPDPGRAPEVAYPPPGALIPPNLNELEVQFRPAAATLFEIGILGDAIDLRIYTPCIKAGTGCGLIPDEATWKLLSQTARGKSVQITLRGAAPDGGGVGTSAPQELSFGDDDIQGGLYYWAASTGGIFRYDFGRRGQKAESFYDPFSAGAICVGCHALSRNGSRIAVGLNIPAPAFMRALDVATRTKLFEVNSIPILGGSDYNAFTSDGEKIITTEGGGLTLRKAQNGMLIGKLPAVPDADMPDIAPDSSQVVYASGGPLCMVGLCVTLSVQNASLFTVPFTGDGFGTPKMILASASNNNYYPSFSPDGRFVVFNRASGDSYDAADARVMVVSSDGGNPIDLGSVNTLAGNSWPKWSPFRQHFHGAPILWITFSSRRDYGLKNLGNSQIWMVPVDTNKLMEGKDPGYPPIRLPFQNAATGNHIAQWVEKIQRAPCGSVDDPPCKANELCMDGMCVPGLE